MESRKLSQVLRSPKGTWQGRSSERPLYFYQIIREISDLNSVLPGDIVLTSYSCDEGVKRNQGRAGAKNGPNAIKSALAKTAFQGEIFDFGELVVEDGRMEEGQELLGEVTYEILARGGFPINLGGGHDIAYGSGIGAIKHLTEKKESLGILNFDAHFDLRKPKPLPNSGSPFYQLLQEARKSDLEVKYSVLGLQKASNTQDLFETAAENAVEYLFDEAMTRDSIRAYIGQQIATSDKLYLSIDLDVLNASFAPGVSASNPFGIDPDLLLFGIEEVVKSGKLIAVDLAEMNPRYDIDGRTAKLAAYIINRICDLFLSYFDEG